MKQNKFVVNSDFSEGSIELLQGSSARLLGPNAFSGAINIVTASKQGRKVNARLTAGSFDTYSQGVSASVGTSKNTAFLHPHRAIRARDISIIPITK
jgi:outer membrane receptor protein involved in Fe transport